MHGIKVLTICPWYYSEAHSTFIHKQLLELRRQGCEIRVITPVPWTPFPLNVISKKWKGYHYIPYRMIRDGIEAYCPRYLESPGGLFFASSGKRMYTGIRKLVAEIHQNFKFDIIHAHVALPNGFAGILIKSEYNKPLLVTIHGQDLQVTVYKNDDCREALAKVFREADKIVTVSTKLKKLAETDFGVPEKLITIHNGISPADVAPRHIDLVSRYAGRKIMLSVSNLITSKGLDLNIRAISQLSRKYPDLKYLVIGSGPENAFLMQLSRDLNVENQVEFLGELPYDKVMQYMAIADIFSLPSWIEGFGTVYIEAMLHGKPVIACLGEGIADVIEDGNTGLMVKPEDVNSLVQALEFLLANPVKASEMGEQARQLVLEKYTWENNARKYMECYKALLAKHG